MWMRRFVWPFEKIKWKSTESPSAGWRWNCITMLLSVQNHDYTVMFYTVVCNTGRHASFHKDDTSKKVLQCFFPTSSSPAIVLTKKKEKKIFKNLFSSFPQRDFRFVSGFDQYCCSLIWPPGVWAWMTGRHTHLKSKHTHTHTCTHTHSSANGETSSVWVFLAFHGDSHPSGRWNETPLWFLPVEKVTVEKNK